MSRLGVLRSMYISGLSAELTSVLRRLPAWVALTVGAATATFVTASDVMIMLEEPVAGETHGGVGNLRGWAVGDSGIDKIEMWIDGVYAFDVPYGGARGDVGGVFPDVTDSTESGFSMAYSFSSLSSGVHSAKAIAYDNLGNTKESVTTEFSVVKLAEDFIGDPNAVNLDGASCGLESDEITLIDASVSGEPVDLLLKWRAAEQGFEIIEIRGGESEVAVLRSRQALPVSPNSAAAETSGSAFRVVLEEPVRDEIHSGVGNLRGWAIASDGIRKIEIFIDGGYAFDAPYGGARQDVAGEFPDVAGSSDSGFSLAFNYSELSAGSHVIEAVAHTEQGATEKSSSTFSIVKFSQDFISGSQSVDLNGADCVTGGNEITISNAVVAGDTYDVVLNWRVAEQGFEIVEISQKDVADNRPFFNARHIDIEIPEALWSDAPISSLEHVTPMDFDNDGLTDLLIEQALAWYGPGESMPNDNPDKFAPSNVILMAYRQIEAGVYQDATKAVFGVDVVEFGELSRKVFTADVNNDGFTDVIGCLHREDGREMVYDQANNLNWNSPQKIIVSNGDGTYRVDVLDGKPLYQHGCATAKMRDGSQHIIYGANGGSSARVYKYEGDQAVAVGGYPALTGWDERAFTPKTSAEGDYSRYLMSAVLSDVKGVAIFEQPAPTGWNPSGSEWVEFGTQTFGQNMGSVDFTNIYSTDVQQQDLFSYDGQLRLSFGVSDSCELRLSQEESVFVIKLDSQLVPSDYSEPIDMNVLEWDYVYTALAMREGEIEELDLLAEERDYPMGFSHLCGDMTGDGLGDLSSRQPQVQSQAVFYENDGQGQLRRTHIKGLDAVTGLPSYAQSGRPYEGRLMDLNGDGIGDWLQDDRGILRINFGIKPQ
jgi:hypothetical protein